MVFDQQLCFVVELSPQICNAGHGRAVANVLSSALGQTGQTHIFEVSQIRYGSVRNCGCSYAKTVCIYIYYVYRC